ncbi:MAG: multidrug transporter [Leeuwenhoekiella sp.]|nr:MAG: multidrug transporter [Leeuwenhoekiella sp.]
MKTNYFLTGLAAAALLMASCEADDTAEIVINSTDNSVVNNYGGGTPTNPGEDIDLGGSYTTDLTLDANNNYTLVSALVMQEGTTLTIPAGTTIRANRGSDVYIAIARGAQIDARGTSTNPIVLTSSSDTPGAGDWGGLILLGNAPINSTTGGQSATSEIGNLPYGGTDESDDSGVIQYVRVMYSGGAADGQTENNGFSFYGVGNGTIVDHVQMYIGADDGLEFYGGTVNVSFISVIGSEDDSIDWTEGYSGTLSDVYVEQRLNFVSEFDKAFECDGFNTDIGNNSDPVYFSRPRINNVLVVGPGSAEGTEAIRLRAGTGGIFNNVKIQGYAEAFDLDGDSGNSPTGDQVVNGDLNVTGVNFVDVTTKLQNDTGVSFDEGDFIISESSTQGTNYSSWSRGWTIN